MKGLSKILYCILFSYGYEDKAVNVNCLRPIPVWRYRNTGESEHIRLINRDYKSPANLYYFV